jgi:alpha-galactosidase
MVDMSITQKANKWILETDHSAYVLGLDQDGRLVHVYWDKRLSAADAYPEVITPRGISSFDMPDNLACEEYPAYAGPKYIDPCLKATFADGTRDVVLRFETAEITDGELPLLKLRTQDVNYSLGVTLCYRLHPAYDLIERWVEIDNTGSAAVLLERVWSAQWHFLANSSYRLTHLSGQWAGEMQINRETLTPGIKVLESRRLTSSHYHAPWFAVDLGDADEDKGKVWFGTLAWSGNWKLSAEVTSIASTRISMGLNDWDFAWKLEPGASFSTPACFGGFTTTGFGGSSRALHDFIREGKLPHGRMLHKVLYNSWEATEFNVSVDSQIELAELAAEMGVELFVMDDGWFHGRDNDRAGLGDWWPDERKFPDGLSPLIKRVNELGMEFGLWIEPEMVNPDSDLYRAHPDWVIHFPGRSRSEARNQLILNFANPLVCQYIIDQIDVLLSENHIQFIKWDMNRNVSEPGWPDAPGDARELWVRYVEGVYCVWQTLASRHPDVIWQACSGGGGRGDLGILSLADQVWVSDNTEPAARLKIQEGFSYLYPANIMEAWVTDSGRAAMPLEFRMHVSMCGSLGIGGHLARWGAARRAEAAHWISVYKEIRPIVQYGDQYRLISPQAHGYSAVQYMGKDDEEGVLFVFRTHLTEPAVLPIIYLRGLQPEWIYEVEGLEGRRSGSAWMEAGLALRLKDDQSALLHIKHK